VKTAFEGNSRSTPRPKINTVWVYVFKTWGNTKAWPMGLVRIVDVIWDEDQWLVEMVRAVPRNLAEYNSVVVIGIQDFWKSAYSIRKSPGI
jgi:hypothetical protein